MRAAVVHAIGEPITLEHRPIPVPGTGQLLVRVVASEIPDAELRSYCGDPRAEGAPFAPAHVAAGWVVSGGAVAGLRAGDHVGVPRVAGDFADYIVADEHDVIPLPRRLDLLAAPVVLCAGARVYGALRSIDARPGHWVAIWGLGVSGRLALQYARAMGMRVVAIDAEDAELELAERMGASLCINSAREDVAAVVHRAVGGAHGALVMVASAAVLMRAMSAVRTGGACAMPVPAASGMPADFSGLVRGGVALRGPAVEVREHLREALQLAASASIGVELERHSLLEIERLLDSMYRGERRGPLVLDMLAEPGTKGRRIAA